MSHFWLPAVNANHVPVGSRGGAGEPPAGGPWGPRGSGQGAGPSSAAGDLLELFVESVKLLASLCQERHEGNIALVRSLKGTTYKVFGTCFSVVSAVLRGVRCSERGVHVMRMYKVNALGWWSILCVCRCDGCSRRSDISLPRV